jgi:hypothetical protein
MRHRSTRRSHNQPPYRLRIFSAVIKPRTYEIIVDFSRTYMKQVVAIHQAMFEKLLFEEDAAVSLDLAELFHDAGKTYLQISERINETCLPQQSLQD